MPLASAVCSDRELPPKGRGRCFSKTGLATVLDFGGGKTVDRRVLFLSGAILASGLLTSYPGSAARTDPVLLSSLRRKMRWKMPATSTDLRRCGHALYVCRTKRFCL